MISLTLQSGIHTLSREQLMSLLAELIQTRHHLSGLMGQSQSTPPILKSIEESIHHAHRLLAEMDWSFTDATLAAINGEMCSIHETPAKNHTQAQISRLKELRSEAVSIHYKRIELARKKKLVTQ